MATKTVVYDEEVIQENAKRLYRQAASIISNSIIVGVVIGGIAGAIGASVVDPQQITLFAIIGATLGGFVGLSRGREKAFRLRLEAQVALCQVQIEKNTRVGTKDFSSGELLSK